MRRSLVIGIVALTLWGILLSVGVALYVRYDPRQLAGLVADKIVASFGVPCRINRLTVGVLPRIHVQLEGLGLDLPHGSRLEVRTATVYMGFSSLMNMRFIPGRIVLDTPVLVWNAPAAEQTHEQTARAPATSPKKDAAQIAQVAQAALPEIPLSTLPPLPPLPDELQGLRIRVDNGQVLYATSARGPSLSARGLHGTVRLPGLFSGSANLHLDEFALYRAQHTDMHTAPAISLHNTRIWANGIDQPEGKQACFTLDTLELTSTVQADGIGQGQVQVDLGMHEQETGDPALGRGHIRFDGELADATPIPVSLDVPFTLADTATMRLDGASLRMEKDAATFTGRLHLGAYRLPEGLLPSTPAPTSARAQDSAATGTTPAPAPTPASTPTPAPSTVADPTLTGQLAISHLSLPRWFEFARDLPGGIERALDNLAGTLDIVLTPRSLSVPRLTATLSGMVFTGTGGVPDFSAPEIRLDGHTASANVNVILPELLNRAPGAMVWPHPAPVTTDPDSEGPDYNIHLTADKATAWKFDMGRFAFRCTPVPGGSRLNIDAGNFYNGTLTSVTDIVNAINLTVQFDKVAIDKPTVIVSGAPLLGGTAQGRAVLTGGKESFDQFLSELSGTVQMQVASGYLGRRVDGQQHPFQTFQIQGKMAGTGLEHGKLPAKLGYSGSWNLSMRAPDWEYTLNLDGTPLFDSRDFGFTGFAEAPGRLQWRGLGFAADMRARFAMDLDKDVFTLRQGEGRIDGGTFNLSLAASHFSGSPQWKGDVSLTSTALGRVLQHNGLLPANMPKGVFDYVQVSADAMIAEKKLELTKLKGRLDDTTFAGSIRRHDDAMPVWQADLDLGALNISRYLPKSDPDSKATPLPKGLLDKVSAKGEIRLQSLGISKLVLRAVRIPLVIEKNRLHCAPISYTPYGGRGEGELEVTAESGGYRTRVRYASNETDMARFSHEAGFKTILSGNGKIFADVAGLVNSSKDIPGAFSGNWSFDVASGAIAELESTARPMTFNVVSASGIMREGVLTTKNFTLQSPTMAARGIADINLNNWTLDCRLNVSTQAFTNVPVGYTGSLDAPERSINALNAVTGAIGKLGSGLFGLVGDILSAPFKLLK